MTATSAPADASPMLAQYLSIKAEHPEHLLFYRMGDFFELFFDDAIAAAAALDIALTRRGQYQGQDIPMCGVPVHSHDSYLARLIRKGFRVALCEQIEDPAEARRRGGRSVVRREVRRVVTPGTLTEESLLEPRTPVYLAAIASTGGLRGLAWLDLSTGEVNSQPVDDAGLAAALARIDPAELLVPEPPPGGDDPLTRALEPWQARLAPQSGQRFDSETGRRRLQTLYGIEALEGFGAFTRAELAALGGLIGYVELTQQGRLPPLKPPHRVTVDGVMEMDPATRRSLDILSIASGERAGSLVDAVDQTLTGAGGRQLRGQLAMPVTDPAVIHARLDCISFFLAATAGRDAIRRLLRALPDMERPLSRLGLGRGGPRDLASIRDGLEGAGAIADVLDPTSQPAIAMLPAGLSEARNQLQGHERTVDLLRAALAADLPTNIRDGGFIADGYSTELDDFRRLRDESRQLILALQSRYVAETGISSLRIRHNNIIGYHVEVTSGHAERLTAAGLADQFIHRQTMANAVRFATKELLALEQQISEAGGRALALEGTIFEQLVQHIAAEAGRIALASGALAVIDVAAALACLAEERRWTRPEIDADLEFSIKAGRHPVVEAALIAQGEGRSFIANDCDLSAGQRLWLLTGPNMAGKSTFLRQNALITILAQAGCFVPAEHVRMGIVDRLFSRVGAADDLARGRSTFMVEMIETATILNRASPRSLVILDEIGRGTATWDGLSIAWAALEHLHNQNGCRGLFATHYHELTALAQSLPALSCHTMRVREWQGEIVLLHEVIPGVAGRSHGIQVARRAGLPATVLRRAEVILKRLEAAGRAKGGGMIADLPLFDAPPPQEIPNPEPPSPSRVETALASVNPDELTPRAALETLYVLKALLPTPR